MDLVTAWLDQDGFRMSFYINLGYVIGTYVVKLIKVLGKPLLYCSVNMVSPIGRGSLTVIQNSET